MSFIIMYVDGTFEYNQGSGFYTSDIREAKRFDSHEAAKIHADGLMNVAGVFEEDDLPNQPTIIDTLAASLHCAIEEAPGTQYTMCIERDQLSAILADRENLKKALEDLIAVASQCDSWATFPQQALDAANKALT